MIINEDTRLKNIELELSTLLNDMEDHYRKSSNLASDIVEKMARKILIEQPELDEFIMCMGDYFFTYKNSDAHLMPITQKMNKNFKYDYVDTEPFLKHLNDLLGKWDNVLKITGDSMRFTAEGEKITNW